MGASEDSDIRRLLGQLLDPNIRFPVRPCLIPDLDVFEMPDGLGIQFRGAETPVIIRGRLADSALTFLLPLLDGSLTLEELLERRPPDLPTPTLLRAVLLLHSKGLLLEADADVSGTSSTDAGAPSHDEEVLHRQSLFWGRHLDLTRSARSAGEIQRRISTANLILVGTGLFGLTTYDLLARSGCENIRVLIWNDDSALFDGPLNGRSQIPEVVYLPSTSIDLAAAQIRSWSDDSELLVTATSDAPSTLFQAINRISLQRDLPWIHANMSASQIMLGPHVRPHDSACYSCMEMRLASMQPLAIEEHLYQEHLAQECPAAERVLLGETLRVATLAAILLVGEVIRAVSGIAPPTLIDSVTQVSPVSGYLQTNRFRRVPRCPDCYRGEMQLHPVMASPAEPAG